MTIQKIFLTLFLFNFSLLAQGAPTCAGLLSSPTQVLEAAESALQDPKADLSEVIRSVESIKLEDRMSPEFSWFLARAHNSIGGFESLNSSYKNLQFIMNYSMSRNDRSLLLGGAFIEAYLHVRKRLGLNSFDSENKTDQNFIDLTKELYSLTNSEPQGQDESTRAYIARRQQPYEFNPSNWGPYSTFQ